MLHRLESSHFQVTEMKPSPMEIDDIEPNVASECLKFVAECEELGKASAIKEDVVRKLINLWGKLRNDYGQDENVDKCLESLLICTSKIIFNLQYSSSKLQRVSAGCKVDLKQAINNCGDTFSDSAKRKNICTGITSLVTSPWTYPSIKKALKDGSKSVSDEDVEELWKTEGWILLETRAEYFGKIMSKDEKAKGHMCFFLNILVQRGREFYDSKNGLTKTLDVYDPFKFSYSKYLEYLEVYTILASQGYFEAAQNITTWSSKTILEVINGLGKKAQDSNSNRLFSKLKFWKGALDATLFLAKTATWNALKSEESEMVHEYFTEWLRLSKVTQKESPFNEIIAKFAEITSTANVYRIANAAVEHCGKTKSITTNYVGIYIRAMTKDVNIIEDIKTNEPETGKEKIRHLQRKLSLSYVQLARFFKQHLKTSKECLLTAFSLYPCVKLFECLFPKSVLLTNISSCKNEEDDFLVEELADMRDVQFDIETSAEDDLQLPEAINQDLESVIHNPRYKGLFRWTSSAEREKLCFKLLKDESLDVIENKKLQFVNVDYDKYKDLPSQYDPDDDGIEKGYRKGESRSRCRAYNSKLIRRPGKGTLKNAARNAKRGATNSSKLVTAFGKARRGRPVKPKMQGGVAKMTYKPYKYNSVTVEREVHQAPNCMLSKSPWYPVNSSENTKLAYGELFFKYVRTYTHCIKETTLKRDLEIEDNLLTEVVPTVNVPTLQLFQQSPDCVPPMGSCQPPPVECPNPINGQHVDSQLHKQDEDPPSSFAVDSSSYCLTNVQPFSSSMSAMHAASTYDQSQNVFEQLSRFHHQSSSPSAMTSPEAQLKQLQKIIVAKMMEMASARNPLSQKLHKFPRELKTEANVTRVQANPKRRTYPGGKLKENKAQKPNDAVKPGRKRRKHSAPLESYQEEIPNDEMSLKDSLPYQKDAMSANDKVNFELDNKVSDESVGTVSSSAEEVQSESVPTEPCPYNSTPAEDNSNKLTSVPTSEIPDFNCAFQIMGIYKKVEEPKTGTTISKTPSVSFPAPKWNGIPAEVVEPGGKPLKTLQGLQMISPFQHPSPVTTLSSQTMHRHRPGDIISQSVVTPKYSNPTAGKIVVKQKKIKVIAVRRPSDAYTTKVSVSSSLRQKDVVDASSGLVCTIPTANNIIIPSESNDVGNIQSSQANQIISTDPQSFDNASSSTKNHSIILEEKDALVLQGEQNNSNSIPNPSDYHKPGIENNIEKIESLSDQSTIQDSFGAENKSVNVNAMNKPVITQVPMLPVLQQPQQQSLTEHNFDIIVPSPSTNDDKNENKSSSSVNELKYVEMLDDKPKKVENVEDDKEPYSTTGDNNSKGNTERGDDRNNDKEDSTTGTSSINALKHTDTETKKRQSSVTVNLNMFQQPLLISCLSSIAKKKDIKIGQFEFSNLDTDATSSKGCESNNDVMLTLSGEGDPDYAKKKATGDTCQKSEKVLPPTQIAESGTQTSESGASRCQEVEATDTKPNTNTLQSNAEVLNDNYQRSLSPTTSKTCDSITPPPTPSEQTALVVLPVTETIQVFTEQREDTQTNVNVSISSGSSKEIKVMPVKNENDSEVSECLSQVINEVESNEKLSVNFVCSRDDVIVLKSEIDVKITTSNYETSEEYNEKKAAVITENHNAHEPEVAIEENYELHFCKKEKVENVNEEAFANVCELPQEALVNNFQKCEPEKNLTGETVVATSHMAEETKPSSVSDEISPTIIIDSNPALIAVADTKELTAGVNQSEIKIPTNSIFDSKLELDFNSDATTDVDEGPPSGILKNECKAPRPLTPVKEIEALYKELQQKIRPKLKRPYDDDDVQSDKLKITPGVTKYVEQHGGRLKKMFLPVVKVRRLSIEQIPPRFHSMLNIKRSSRILDQRQKPTKTIQMLFQSNVSKVDGSSSSNKMEENSLDDDDDIIILEEIEKQPQRLISSTDGNLRTENVTSSLQRCTSTRSRRSKKTQLPPLVIPPATIFSNQNDKATEIKQNVDTVLIKSDTILEAGGVKRKQRSANNSRTNDYLVYSKSTKKCKFTNADNATATSFDVFNEQCSAVSRVDDSNAGIRSPLEETEEYESPTESPKLSDLMYYNGNEAYPHMEFPPSSPDEIDLDESDPLGTDDCSISELPVVSSKDHIILDSETSSEANEEYDTLVNGKGLKGGTTVQTSDMQQMHTPDDFEPDDDQVKSSESKSEAGDKSETSETTPDMQQKQTRNDLKTVDICDIPQDQQLRTSEHLTTSKSSYMQHDKQIKSSKDSTESVPEICEMQQHQQVRITEDVTPPENSEMQKDQNVQMLEKLITPDIEEADICDPELQAFENSTVVNLVTPSYTSVVTTIHDSEDTFDSAVEMPQLSSPKSLVPVITESDFSIIQTLPNEAGDNDYTNQNCEAAEENSSLVTCESIPTDSDTLSNAVRLPPEQEVTENNNNPESTVAALNISGQYCGEERNNTQQSASEDFRLEVTNDEQESESSENKEEVNEDTNSVLVTNVLSPCIICIELTNEEIQEESTVLLEEHEATLENPIFLDSETIASSAQNDVIVISQDKEPISFYAKDDDSGNYQQQFSKLDSPAIVSSKDNNDHTYCTQILDIEVPVSEQFKNDDCCSSPSDNQVVEITPIASLHPHASQSTSQVVSSKTNSTTNAMSPKSYEYELFNKNHEISHSAESQQQAASMTSSEDLEILHNNSQNSSNTFVITTTEIRSNSSAEKIDCITNEQFENCENGMDAKVVGAEDMYLFKVVGCSISSQPIDCHLNEQAADEQEFNSSSSEEKQQECSSTTQIINDSNNKTVGSPMEIYVPLESHVNLASSNCDDLNETETSQPKETLGSEKTNVRLTRVAEVGIDMEDDGKRGGSKYVREEISSTSVMDNNISEEVKRLVAPTNKSVYEDSIRTEFPVIPPKLQSVDEILINSDSDDEPPVLEKQIDYNAD